MSLSRFVKVPLHKQCTGSVFNRILSRRLSGTTSENKKLVTNTDLPSHARVVICGGGITGTSIAYHLAERGWNDVVLLEQGK